jgi:glutathione S-transferase
MKLIIANKNYSSWSLRPWLVMQHFALPFNEEILPLSGEGWKENLVAKTPYGSVPTLIDGDLAIGETIAIIEYLADTNPQKPIWPQSIRARALARAASAQMHAGFMKIRNAAPMNLRASHPNRIDIKEIQPDLDMIEKLWGKCLGEFGGPFLFGEFCAADAMFAPLATRLKTYDLPMSDLVKSYVEAIYSLSSFQIWYEAALKETSIVEVDEIDFIQGKNS